ncbi:beta-L-arabinofuranosidase domain-containing protein [Acutalibacter caecimuris]|uniref:beta-L-arabinofuranosidase domain-containing protein n=1 Tax=Acutalibacter caecimuris TaxID=3093657 RepID=UPI002AC8A40D|nr:beta-L-arabinofuranosidase domain-containing protein [Acutalibacter sp. M00118]
MSNYHRLTAGYSAYSPRLSTDALFIPGPGAFAYTGPFHRAVRFIQQHQLLDAALWARFAEQFTRPADDQDLGWRCEYWGKLMRGGSMVWAYTQDPELYRQLETTVRAMLQNAGPDGRLSTYSREAQFQGWDIWGRKYVLLGMEYFYDICGDDSLKAALLASLKAQADCIMARFGQGKADLRQASCHWEGLNSSSLLEPVVRLYNMTGEEKYLAFARYIVGLGGIQSANIFELALEDKLAPWQYPVTKAYEMMSCFEGLLEYVRASGEQKWGRAVVNFTRQVLASDITIIGSAGCTHELFDHARLGQADPHYTGIMQETCVTVTWMKLCGQVLCFTGDPVFGDAMERSLYNALLGAVNTRKVSHDPLSPHGWLPFDSYSPLRADFRGQAVGGRMVIADNTIYGCCAAIGAAGLGAAAQSSAFHSRQGVAVNLYFPGALCLSTPQGNRLGIRMDTTYPVGESITLDLSLDEPEPFELALRVPNWCAAPKAQVNGKAVPAASGWLRLERLWHSGDRICLRLPMAVEAACSWQLGEGSGKLPPSLAFVRGPVVLAVSAEFPQNSLSAPLDLSTPLDPQPLPLTEVPFEAQQAFTIALQNGRQLRLADYASVGKGYDQMIAAWVPVSKQGALSLKPRPA